MVVVVCIHCPSKKIFISSRKSLKNLSYSSTFRFGIKHVCCDGTEATVSPKGKGNIAMRSPSKCCEKLFTLCSWSESCFWKTNLIEDLPNVNFYFRRPEQWWRHCWCRYTCLFYSQQSSVIVAPFFFSISYFLALAIFRRSCHNSSTEYKVEII